MAQSEYYALFSAGWNAAMFAAKQGMTTMREMTSGLGGLGGVSGSSE